MKENDKIYDFSSEFILAVPSEMKEKKFTLGSLTSEEADTLYQGFHDAYMKAVGASWDQYTFEVKASNWTFFGDITGGVALRHQRSGLWKLNASYGYPRQVLKGFFEMQSSIGNEPIWGAMTDDLCALLEKASKGEFKRPPKLLVKILLPYLKKAMGADAGQATSKGSIIVDTPAGKMEKFFIANKAYYKELLDNSDKYLGDKGIPTPIKNTLIGLLGKLI